MNIEINYAPNYSYQDEIEVIQTIMDNNSDINNIEVPDVEGSDAYNINKNLNSLHSSFESIIDQLSYGLKEKIAIDFEEKANLYAVLVNSGIEDNTFPLKSWIGVIKSNSYYKSNKINWEIDYSWLKINDFNIDNLLAQYLYISNTFEYLDLVKIHNPSIERESLKKLKELYSNKKNMENIYNYIIYSTKDKLFKILANSSYPENTDPIKILPPLIEKEWTYLAGVELCNNWENEDKKNELLNIFITKATLEEKKDFIKDQLLNIDKCPDSFLKFKNKYGSKNLEKINWDEIEKVFALNKKFDLNCEEVIIEVLTELINKNKYYLNESEENKKLNFFSLSTVIEEKSKSKLKNKI